MSISVEKILSFVPDELLTKLSLESKVDKVNTYKLPGSAVFKVLLYGIIEEDKLSLRVIEDIFKRQNFKFLHEGKEIKFSRSGMSDRLKTIEYEFFEKVFDSLKHKFNEYLDSEESLNIIRFDSTILTLSSELLKGGYKTSMGNKNQIKFSIGFNGLPLYCNIRADLAGNSEDVALRDIIKTSSLGKDDIVVFDRGLSARKTFKDFSETGIMFVTRLNDRANYRVIKELSLPDDNETETLIIKSDNVVQLRSKDVHWVKQEFRLINAIIKESGNKILFLSNVLDISAKEITNIYKKRWDIEVFFKFIKQHLNAKHFLSRNINGISAVFYMVLIVSLMMLVFKKANNIAGYKDVKMQFKEQLRRMIVYEIVLFYQHYPDKLHKEDFLPSG